MRKVSITVALVALLAGTTSAQICLEGSTTSCTYGYDICASAIYFPDTEVDPCVVVNPPHCTSTTQWSLSWSPDVPLASSGPIPEGGLYLWFVEPEGTLAQYGFGEALVGIAGEAVPTGYVAISGSGELQAFGSQHRLSLDLPCLQAQTLVGQIQFESPVSVGSGVGFGSWGRVKGLYR